MTRPTRAIVTVLGTLFFLVAGLAYPIAMRADAWRSAVWTVPVLSWLPREARLPVLAGLAVVLGAIVAWRMTLAADARTPRLRLATVATLVTGPRGFRTRLRDIPGM